MVAAATAALSVPGAALARLAAMTDPAAAAAAPSLQDPELRRIISAYFEAATTVPAAAAATIADAAAPASASAAVPAKPPGAKAAFLRADIKVLMRSCAGVRLTARAAARILHGVGSPSFPATAWSRNPFWGRHAAVPFDDVKRIAHDELVANVF
jgi:ATP-dependent DNA helicase Q4